MEFKNILNNNSSFIISVLGPHAHETLDDIMLRKIRDIEKLGMCFWVCRSYAITPEIMKTLSLKKVPYIYLIFIKTASNGLGKDTKIVDKALLYKKPEDELWLEIPKEMSPVTGKMPSFGFCIEELKLIKTAEKIDLNEFCEMDDKNIKIHIGKSTLAIKKRDWEVDVKFSKSNEREIIGYAKIKPILYRFCEEIEKNKGSEKQDKSNQVNKKRKFIEKEEKLKKKIKFN